MGGRLCDEKGRPKEMDSFVRSREKELWSSAKYSEVQAFTQRTLAISMQKLMEVFVRSLACPFSWGCRLTDSVISSALNWATSASAVSRTILKSSSTLVIVSRSANSRIARSPSSSQRWTSKSS